MKRMSMSTFTICKISFVIAIITRAFGYIIADFTRMIVC